MDSNSENWIEWRGRIEKRGTKGKRRKARSCADVYRDSKATARTMGKKGRSRQRKNMGLVEAEPVFFPNPGKQVAGDSLNDSGILNYNNCVKLRDGEATIQSIRDFAKGIGVEAQGNEDTVLRKHELMEKRDKE
ncbi:hypothetical protein SLA2020_219690 [Shorea laevis]